VKRADGTWDIRIPEAVLDLFPTIRRGYWFKLGLDQSQALADILSDEWGISRPKVRCIGNRGRKMNCYALYYYASKTIRVYARCHPTSTLHEFYHHLANITGEYDDSDRKSYPDKWADLMWQEIRKRLAEKSPRPTPNPVVYSEHDPDSRKEHTMSKAKSKTASTTKTSTQKEPIAMYAGEDTEAETIAPTKTTKGEKTATERKTKTSTHTKPEGPAEDSGVRGKKDARVLVNTGRYEPKKGGPTVMSEILERFDGFMNVADIVDRLVNNEGWTPPRSKAYKNDPRTYVMGYVSNALMNGYLKEVKE
jgi:hypothetical protein